MTRCAGFDAAGARRRISSRGNEDRGVVVGSEVNGVSTGTPFADLDVEFRTAPPPTCALVQTCDPDAGFESARATQDGAKGLGGMLDALRVKLQGKEFAAFVG